MAFGRGGLESAKVLPCRQTARAPANPSFELPLPLLVEQKEIVRSVKALFALADQIEARFTQAPRADGEAHALPPG
jgi:hypothetical protein